jgi:hypothetical protein
MVGQAPLLLLGVASSSLSPAVHSPFVLWKGRNCAVPAPFAVGTATPDAPTHRADNPTSHRDGEWLACLLGVVPEVTVDCSRSEGQSTGQQARATTENNRRSAFLSNLRETLFPLRLRALFARTTGVGAALRCSCCGLLLVRLFVRWRRVSRRPSRRPITSTESCARAG